MSKLTISNSALSQFLSGCPARYTFYQKYNMVKVPPAMDFGIRVHRMLEAGLPNPHTPPADLDAAEIAERLLNLVEKAQNPAQNKALFQHFADALMEYEEKTK